MSEFFECIEKAKNLRSELEEMAALNKRIAEVQEEIAALQAQKAEVESRPDRVNSYRLRLSKVQNEIERRDAIDAKIESPEDISQQAQFLTRNQLSAKVLEYFKTLFSENSSVITVKSVKIKINCLKISLKVNQVLPVIREKLPDQVSVYNKFIVAPICDYILMYNPVLTTVSEGVLYVAAYMANKRAETPEGELQQEIMKALGVGEEYLVTSKNVYENISKLSLHNEILAEMKAHIVRNLHKISLKQLERYNNEVFYGTVYHIEDTDRWMCDNLVGKLEEIFRAEKYEEISGIEKKGLENKPRESPPDAVDALAEAMHAQSVEKVSHGLYKAAKVLQRIEATKRSKDQMVKKTVINHLRAYFAHIRTRVVGQNPRERIRALLLWLADAQTAQSIGYLEETSRKSKIQVFSHLEEDLSSAPGEAVEKLHASVYEAALAEFHRKGASGAVEETSTFFLSTCESLFAGAFRQHIQTTVYNRLLKSAYELLDVGLHKHAPENWARLLEELLSVTDPFRQMLEEYPKIQVLHRLFAAGNSATAFIEAYNGESSHFEDETLVQDIAAFLFGDHPAFHSILRHLQKTQKKA
ncbi:uncharacterized protein NEMAJ01_1826 [Nematocida major]|uniref:uncharacterized protein n=1 Tax=Nematocida major TaxID=1912982 RepID=UPI0020084D2E|nr:uncharacterized protein NEMAJ01_1826 [Nematocida major]KAH9386930.1 hypothetical protein NEMAJ01_1826 [Nematocida major]